MVVEWSMTKNGRERRSQLQGGKRNKEINK